jgi:hypothetical protein
LVKNFLRKFTKGVDKSLLLWYNNIRKNEREESLMIYTGYFFRTYIADNKHISSKELCATPEEAVEKACKWSAFNGKAEAVKVEIDLETLKVTETLL